MAHEGKIQNRPNGQCSANIRQCKLFTQLNKKISQAVAIFSNKAQNIYFSLLIYFIDYKIDFI